MELPVPVGWSTGEHRGNRRVAKQKRNYRIGPVLIHELPWPLQMDVFGSEREVRYGYRHLAACETERCQHERRREFRPVERAT